MEELPVEVVGKILSHIAAARDVVLASGTCRKWRQAFREHLRALSFKSTDWFRFRALSTGEIEDLITRSIFQTTGLQSLVIEMEDCGVLSVSSVVSWLLYTRSNLQELQCIVSTAKFLNVVDIFGRGRLETLALAYDEIKNVDPNFHRFSSLRSLSLIDVIISELDLSALLAACPKLESLELIYNDDELFCPLSENVKAPNLRRFYLDGLAMKNNNLILELDSIERLYLGGCSLNSFKLIGKGSLKRITMAEVTISHLELCDSTQNLECIDIMGHMIPKSDFYPLVSKSSKLRVFRLDVEEFRLDEVIDLETIAMNCPQLTHLFLSFDRVVPDDMLLPYCLQGSARFENLVLLEVKWSYTLKDNILEFFMGLMEHCPSLKKLVISGRISGLEDHRDAQVVSRLIGCIIQITRKYVGLDVQVDFR